jgi:hypothetical protein
MIDSEESLSAEPLARHEPLTPEDMELLATPDEELTNKVSQLCFDYEKFTGRVFNGDRWQQLLQAHLYFDHVITRMLEDALPNPDAIRLRRTSFSQKVQLISAMDLLPPSLIPPIEFINSLRNKIAHELNFEISDDAVKNLVNCTPKRLRQIALEQRDRDDGPLSFHEVLHIVLIQIETLRQDHQNERLLKRKHVLNTRVVPLKRKRSRSGATKILKTADHERE